MSTSHISSTSELSERIVAPVKRPGQPTKAEMASLVKKMDVPPEYRRCGFTNYDNRFDNKEAVAEIFRLVKDQQSVIICDKATGVGKTHLATAALKYANWRYGGRGLWLSLPNLIIELKQAGVDYDSKWDEFRRNLRMVVFDEIGTDFRDKYSEKYVRLIFWHCWDYNVQIIGTSGTDAAALRELCESGEYHDKAFLRRMGTLVQLTKENEK